MRLAAMTVLLDKSKIIQFIRGSDHGGSTDLEQLHKSPNTRIALASFLIEVVNNSAGHSSRSCGKARQDVQGLMREQHVVLLQERHLNPAEFMRRAICKS